MEQFEKVLNELMIEVYHNIGRLEEMTLKQAQGLNLTINEMHLIEYLGRGGPEGLTIRQLAEGQRVTSPSMTVAVQKLETKGYVQKVACEADGRVVRVRLTPGGKRVDAYHRYYHRMMVKAIIQGMTEEEKSILLSAVEKLNDYFVQSIGDET